jgi:ribosome-binding protein aMBF1 (putative translation factor)
MQAKKCPVCGWEIKDKGHAVKAGKKTVVVCCDDCVKEVEKNPSKFAAAK